MTNTNYLEVIQNIAYAFTDKGIPYTMNSCCDGWQLRFPWCNGDMVCHSWSYGNEIGYVETMGFPWDDKDEAGVTVHSPEEVIDLVSNYYGKVG